MHLKHINEILVYADTYFTGFNENLKIKLMSYVEINTMTDFFDTVFPTLRNTFFQFILWPP